MSKTKLNKAPLKEVVFELHWECSVDNFGIQTDPGFDLAQGRFAEQLKKEFPLHRKLIPDGTPLKIFGAPLHQYWRSELIWPVIQHGQGMIAVNEIEQGYEWENSYKPLILATINKLENSYEETLTFNKLKLQYIDAWDLNDCAPEDFMNKNLQTRIITNYSTPGKLISFNIQQNFELSNGSIMNLNITNGVNNQTQKQSVVWSTTVEQQSNFKIESVDNWIEEAHTNTSEMFKRMLNPEFYASLDR
ncbi:TIGR04255 family protein [Cytophaga aurantiaca]|uniref:TIGR04255 family protein n=1 Tax=Cytophaga aurantiaca TaxID=29530 RepID=UPI00036FA6D4|nr:TIGR04255 family protein [Cytophaga aurantiaca]